MANINPNHPNLSEEELSEDDIWLAQAENSVHTAEDVDQPQLEQELELSLALKVIGRNPPNFSFLKNTLFHIWEVKNKIIIRSLEPFVYSVTFFQLEDKFRVLKGGPWNMGNDLLVVAEMCDVDAYDKPVFKETKIWIRVHDLPLKGYTHQVAEAVGEVFGGLDDYDLPKDEQEAQIHQAVHQISFRKYLRVKTTINIQRPLLRKGTIEIVKKDGSKGTYDVRFSYENVPDVCYYCGKLGHQYSSCRKFEGKSIEKLRYNETIKSEHFYPRITNSEDTRKNRSQVQKRIRNNKSQSTGLRSSLLKPPITNPTSVAYKAKTVVSSDTQPLLPRPVHNTPAHPELHSFPSQIFQICHPVTNQLMWVDSAKLAQISIQPAQETNKESYPDPTPLQMYKGISSNSTASDMSSVLGKPPSNFGTTNNTLKGPKMPQGQFNTFLSKIPPIPLDPHNLSEPLTATHGLSSDGSSAAQLISSRAPSSSNLPALMIGSYNGSIDAAGASSSKRKSMAKKNEKATPMLEEDNGEFVLHSNLAKKPKLTITKASTRGKNKGSQEN